MVNTCYSNPKIDIRFGHDPGFSGSIGGPVLALTGSNGVAADVVGLEHEWIMTFHILGISSSQLTMTNIFSEELKPPTSNGLA